jgi:hypothetical protein
MDIEELLVEWEGWLVGRFAGVVSRGEPATQVELAEAGVRLGLDLPGDVLGFYRAANGLYEACDEVQTYRILPCQELRFVRDAEPDWYSMVLSAFDWAEAEDDVYFRYGRMQRPEDFRIGYLKQLIAFSEVKANGDMMLLNPEVRVQDDAWEVWEFGYNLPGVVRYRSVSDFFRERLAGLGARSAV